MNYPKKPNKFLLNIDNISTKNTMHTEEQQLNGEDFNLVQSKFQNLP